MNVAIAKPPHRSQMSQSKSKIVTFILAISFVFQYNFIFSANYLWLEYWTGANIRTSISFVTIIVAISILFLDLNLNKIPKSFTAALLFYFCYGIVVGAIRNATSVAMAAESIFWIEIYLYMMIFLTLEEKNLFFLVRVIIYYAAINSLISVGYFWIIRDQVMVAAVVGGQRIIRLADLFAPMLLLLFVLYNAVNNNRKLALQWTLPVALIILLGFFRSVWAALILSYIASNLIYASGRIWVRVFIIGIFVVSFIATFEYIYFYFFAVPNVISGRIVAGVGTQDSLGRISSAGDVIGQWLEDPLSIIFGSGFGRMVWFVNNFGYGEIYALQPLGSLSNYYVVFLFQTGTLITFGYAVYILRSIRVIMVSYHPEVAKVLLFILFYYLAQWLTFPTTIHYPVAAIIGLYVALAATARKAERRIEGSASTTAKLGNARGFEYV
jgi:hypothetical protein